MSCFQDITFNETKYYLIWTRLPQKHVFTFSPIKHKHFFSFAFAVLALVRCRISMTLHAPLHRQSATSVFVGRFSKFVHRNKYNWKSNGVINWWSNNYMITSFAITPLLKSTSTTVVEYLVIDYLATLAMWYDIFGGQSFFWLLGNDFSLSHCHCWLLHLNAAIASLLLKGWICFCLVNYAWITFSSTASPPHPFAITLQMFWYLLRSNQIDAQKSQHTYSTFIFIRFCIWIASQFNMPQAKTSIFQSMPSMPFTWRL